MTRGHLVIKPMFHLPPEQKQQQKTLMVKAAFMLIILDVFHLMFTVGVQASASAEATRCRLLRNPLGSSTSL